MAAIPEGFSSVTPTLVVDDAAQAIELYKKAFGAKEIHRMNCPQSGKIMHACIEIGTSKLFLSDAGPADKGCASATSSNFYVYVNDADKIFGQAKHAGLQETMPVQDMFWGDRMGNVKDKFGNSWTVATHVRDVSPQEMQEAMKKMASQAA